MFSRTFVRATTARLNTSTLRQLSTQAGEKVVAAEEQAVVKAAAPVVEETVAKTTITEEITTKSTSCPVNSALSSTTEQKPGCQITAAACKFLSTPFNGLRPGFVISWLAIGGAWCYLATGAQPTILKGLRRANYALYEWRTEMAQKKEMERIRNADKSTLNQEEEEFFKKRNSDLAALRNQAAH